MIYEHRSENKKLLKMIFGVLLLLGLGYLVYNAFFQSDRTREDDISNDRSGLVATSQQLDRLEYISALDWPPTEQVLEKEFECGEAGSPEDRAGRTELRTINGRNYCVTEVTQGAAGSIYTQYAYAYPSDGKTSILTFSLRFSQCANYDKRSRSECEAERASFSVDELVEKYVQERYEQ